MTRSSRLVVAAVLAALLVAVLALAACQGGGGTGGSGIAPSFTREVAPVIADKCAGCHQSGGIAPFPLETADQVASRAGLIGAAVQARVMPPWPPGGESPAYAGEQERTLSERERATLVAWATGGGKVDGPAAEPVPQPAFRARQGETLLRLRMPVAYRPSAPSGTTDDYRCFLLDPRLDRDASVTSASIRPGQPKVVHHVILFRVDPDAVAEAESLDAGSPGQGWRCFGDTGLSLDPEPGALDDADWVSAWAPGGEGGRFPDGTGVPLEAGGRIVMQVHYNLLNGRAPDRSEALLTVAPASAKLTPLRTMLLPAPVELPCAEDEQGRLCNRDAAVAELGRKYGPEAALVPTGLLFLCGGDPGGDTGVTTCDRTIREPTTIRIAAGHMHLLGSSVTIELNPDTPRAQVLLDIPRWDFHWQNAYAFVRPVRARPGDVVRVTCRHDVGKRVDGEQGVPKAPRYILWGEGTTDEMCLGILQVTRG
jgi:Copper type II ascorbate-dependent monooxygenase, N-terminal domain/Copper type II ascorbate-dependent monooxygenase, C-terminal domain